MTVIVIGGGPAGMMSAISSAKAGSKTILIEKNNRLGCKLHITGKGRCNITNNCEPALFIKNIVSNPKFMTSSIYSFTPKDTIEFFEKENLQLKTERGNRVFPASDKSQDIINCFSGLLKRLNVEVHLNETFRHFNYTSDKIDSVVTDKGTYAASSVILATGGASYKATGSDGYGYKIVQTIGHSVTQLKPALCPLIISSALAAGGAKIPLSQLKFPEGLSLKNAGFKVVDNINNKTIIEDFGEAIFTNNGMSGPVILTISSKINRLDISRLNLVIDLKAALTQERLDDRILRDFEQKKNKAFKNALAELLPLSMIEMMIALSGVAPEKKVNSITRIERQNLVKVLKSLTFHIEGLESIETAIVTAGGVSVVEIDPKKMQSKLICNLYFAGEIIDVDALTGGFNIQLALSSGYVAGTAAAKGAKNA
ncbi:MAG: NAD(P)/FAD-dependent oxidoreductase [Christensenellaceae bacterium]|nr:NAD(P)/FAD-dependent oxidoreductase [Christensenellaceae bacterium]